MLQAGVAETLINPPMGLMLGGYARGDRHNKGIHDPLYATALVLKQEERTLVLVTLDILSIPKATVTAVKKAVHMATGIPRDHILLSCSHTHSGPRMGTKEDKSTDYQIYENSLSRKLTILIQKALSQLFPAQLGTMAGHCGARDGVGGNRFVRGGVADDTLGLLAVKDDADRVRLVLANYALHPTVLHEDNVLVSADYPGAIRRRVQEAYPGALFGFLQGASGNQSTRYFRKGQGFDEVERIGSALGDKAVACLAGMHYGEPEILFLAGSSPLFFREYPPEEKIQQQIREKNAQEQKLISANAPYADVQDAHNQAIGAECLLENAREAAEVRARVSAEGETIRIAALRLGATVFFFTQGELFLEYALEIRAASAARNTFIVTLTNGALPGYVYTRSAMSMGGYEVDNSMLAPDTGETLSLNAQALVKEISR